MIHNFSVFSNSFTASLYFCSSQNSGFVPITTTLKNADSLRRDLGAIHLFYRSLSDSVLVGEIAKVVNGKSVKLVYDTVSEQSTQQTALALLDEGDHLALLLPAAVEVPKGVVIIQVYGGHKAGTASLLSTLHHDNLRTLLEQGIIKLSRFVLCE